jgi:hypothetical protein
MRPFFYSAASPRQNPAKIENSGICTNLPNGRGISQKAIHFYFSDPHYDNDIKEKRFS